MVTLFQFAILLLAGLLLLPTYGIVGMAQTICAMRVTVALMVLVAGHRLAAAAVDAVATALPARRVA